MTDFFLVLMLPGAGDELQGLKKGVVEIADMPSTKPAQIPAPRPNIKSEPAFQGFAWDGLSMRSVLTMESSHSV